MAAPPSPPEPVVLNPVKLRRAPRPQVSRAPPPSVFSIQRCPASSSSPSLPYTSRRRPRSPLHRAGSGASRGRPPRPRLGCVLALAACPRATRPDAGDQRRHGRPRLLRKPPFLCCRPPSMSPFSCNALPPDALLHTKSWPIWLFHCWA